MSRTPGGWGWRYESETHGGRSHVPGWRGLDVDSDEPPPSWDAGGDEAAEMRPIPWFWVAGAVVVLALGVYALRSRGHHPTTPPVATIRAVANATPPPLAVWSMHPIVLPTTGPSASIQVSTTLSSGPGSLWPVSGHVVVGEQVALLGDAYNSQDGIHWDAVRPPNAGIGWIPDGSIASSGNQPQAGAAPVLALEFTHAATLTISAQVQALPVPTVQIVGIPPSLFATPTPTPRLVDKILHVPAGAWMRVHAVIPAYLFDMVGRRWVDVLTSNGNMWLSVPAASTRLFASYIIPISPVALSTWGAPLTSAGVLYGAYGEALGNGLWPLRAATDVRGTYGEPVLAAQDGTVVLVGTSARWQTSFVLIRQLGDWDGWYSAYINMATDAAHPILVRAGQQVHKGDTIGYLGQAPGSPSFLRFLIATPDGTPIESQNILQWP